MKTAMGMFAALMVALAMTGVAFAWWTETLKIEGSVATGKLGVDFNNPETSCDPEMTCTAVKDANTITVTVGNAYPCGLCVVTFDIHNTGTIPAKVTGITLTKPSELDVTLENIAIGNIIGIGGSKVCKLTVHVAEAAKELSTYTFTVTIDFGQFNAP
jgi:predicted ribosomally synthesized peptide with SipW-like signal peptide